MPDLHDLHNADNVFPGSRGLCGTALAHIRDTCLGSGTASNDAEWRVITW